VTPLLLTTDLPTILKNTQTVVPGQAEWECDECVNGKPIYHTCCSGCQRPWPDRGCGTTCSACDGNGIIDSGILALGTPATPCNNCKGRGEHFSDCLHGFWVNCPRCKGTGVTSSVIHAVADARCAPNSHVLVIRHVQEIEPVTELPCFDHDFPCRCGAGVGAYPLPSEPGIYYIDWPSGRHP